MTNRFVQKLQIYGVLSDEDVVALVTATSKSRRVAARTDIIREGDRPGPVIVILEGWACRYKILPDGGRQIIAFMVPGDSCDMHVAVLAEMDHSIQTITEAKIAMISRAEIEQLVGDRPEVARAFWSTQLVDEAVLRAWIISMGRRSSEARVAHLLCELYLRVRHVGLVPNTEFELPISQIMLSDAVGLTPVHVNRVVRKLLDADAIEIRRSSIVIIDPDKLTAIAKFDDNYLHQRLRRA